MGCYDDQNRILTLQELSTMFFRLKSYECPKQGKRIGHSQFIFSRPVWSNKQAFIDHSLWSWSKGQFYVMTNLWDYTLFPTTKVGHKTIQGRIFEIAQSIQKVCSKTNFSNCLRKYAETKCFTNSDEEPLFWLWWSREFPQEMQDLSWLFTGQRTVSLSPVDKAKDSLISTVLCFPVLSASRF